jgi:acyl carrier protein
MVITRDDILAVIYKELEKINRNKIEITEDTDMTGELNIDSVTVMDLMFTLEEEFDIAVPLNDLADIQKVGELTTLVQGITKENAA